jgi:hypothetical protein
MLSLIGIEKPVFFTYPLFDYPYLMVTPRLYKQLFKLKWNHAILDCGVDLLFLIKKFQDYSNAYLFRYEKIASQLTEIFKDKIWCVIPDYPDDFRCNPIENNVEKTLKNIEIFSSYEGINWIYPLQADYLNVESFKYCCREVKKYNPEKVAIGTVCKTRNIKFILKCCAIARNYFPNSWIHAFGVTLNALPSILNLIDSFDSCSYFYESRILDFKNDNPNTIKSRKEAFSRFLSKIDKIKRNRTANLISLSL